MGSDPLIGYDAQRYHSMRGVLWSAVKPNGVDDCATLAVARIRELEAIAPFAAEVLK